VRDAGGEAQCDNGVNGHAAKREHAVAEYIYRQADGTPYLRVQRTSKKAFWQSHWDGRAWAKGKPPGPKIPYRLPELAERPVNPVYIVEGEKDADRPAGLGLVATTSSEGAEKWTRELNQHFRGRHVFVLPDNDDPGRKHGRQVAENLQGIAETVTVVELPGLPPKGDVSDWLDAGGTVEALGELAAGAAEWIEPRKAFRWIDMSTWDTDPVPERKWAIKDRVPLNQAGLFSGEGGTGKSIIELMKNVARLSRGSA
jgi:hypothetical protein